MKLNFFCGMFATDISDKKGKDPLPTWYVDGSPEEIIQKVKRNAAAVIAKYEKRDEISSEAFHNRINELSRL